MSYTFVIGDIHGCRAALEMMISRIEMARPEGGTVVFARPGSDGRVSLWSISERGGSASALTTVSASTEQAHRFLLDGSAMALL